MSNQPTSTCSAASEDLLLPLGGPDSEPLDSAKSNPTAKPSSKSTGRKSRSTTTSENCEGGGKESTYLQGDFLVSPFLLPGSEEAKMMTVTSGRKCSVLLKSRSPLGLLAKMLLESSQWNSTKCVLTWRPLATKSNRLLFQLVPSMHRIKGIESGLLPTITTSDSKGSSKKRYKGSKESHGKLCEVLRTSEEDGQYLHPEFAEHLMGYPIGHTALKDSATPSSRKSHTKSLKALKK